MLYQIHQASVTLGGETILSHLDMEIRGREKIALVGPNGAGKTTLLGLIAGEILPDRDDRRMGPVIQTSRRITIGMLRQQPLERPSETVEEHLLREYCISRGWNPEDMAADADRAFPMYERERYMFETEYDRIFTGFGFSREDKKRKMGEFSGGQQTRIALIRLLLMEPDLLLLDEPTNHLDVDTVEWLEEYLRNYPKAVVMVSHDRFFLDQVAEVIYDLRRGRLTRYVGNYSSYKEQRRKNLQLQYKKYMEQEAEVKRLEELILKFRNKPRKAAFARSRKQILDRMERMEKPEEGEMVGNLPDILPRQLGSKWVWEAEDGRIGYEKPLHSITFRLRRGQKIGVIGPNGSGKSTFLKTVAGGLHLLSGKMNMGLGIDMAYFDQQTAALESELTVLAYVRERFPSMLEKELRQTLGRYGLRGKDVMKVVSDLSGGEKTRLVLATLLLSGPNLLILDEPTNHLDVEAMEALEEVLRSYRGTVLIVSHDRYFLQRTVESLLVFGEGEAVLYYPFGYEHYKKRRNLAKSATDLSALRTAEEQALIEGLKAVPKGEMHRIREISSEEGYSDWRFRLVKEELDRIKAKIEDTLALHGSEEYWMNPQEQVRIDRRMQENETEYHRCCMEWFDIWMDSLSEEEEEIWEK